jgi:hypothetical protein
MQISELMHNGDTYKFEPPVDIGDRQRVQSIYELTTLALFGTELPLISSDLAGAFGKTALGEPSTKQDMVGALNRTLAGKHIVTLSNIAA